jgi:hypothetical protein
VISAELMQQATFAAIGQAVQDVVPASDLYSSVPCSAETDCWQERDGMWVCSPCLRRFRDARPQDREAGYLSAEERLAQHIREHLAQKRPMLIAFYCLDHDQMERPALA